MTLLALILLGLCFGSFVNAWVWRLHQQATSKNLSAKQRRELSMAHGRSMCSKCRHPLAWNDLLPVVSWVMLGGKCRYCHKPIADPPLVEVLLPVLFALSYISWPYGFQIAGWLLFGLWLVFLVCFMALAVYDLKWMELPNKIVYPLVGLAIAQVVLKGVATDNILEAVRGAFFGFVLIGGLFYGLFQLSNGKWIGGGDVKLGFMIGPLVGGGVEAMMVIFFASVIGTLVSVPIMARKSLKMSSRIPFGPFLLLATWVIYIYGQDILSWYTHGLL
jgi:prepilin signal peptidase PulO-like enzyme (type II secretory pathway)